MKKYILIVLLTLVSFNTYAKPQTVVLAVPTVSCATCPFTVKLSLKQVGGVDKADVSFNEKRAVVVFNNKQATINELIVATTSAGYPSTIIEQEVSK